MEGSGGAYSDGRGEPLDVGAALDEAAGAAIDGPLALIGWSFGADMALGIDDPRIAGWVGIAPPLRFLPKSVYDEVGRDKRPKLLVLAAHDEFRAPAEIEAATAGWASTRIETVSGASHFFVGRTERVATLVGDFVSALAAPLRPDGRTR